MLELLPPTPGQASSQCAEAGLGWRRAAQAGESWDLKAQRRGELCKASLSGLG